ncbi:hypothetical protein PAPYR_1207 [Paratrimastix pyriformis]|uniref:Uncharacterized protein n=1 Tax=Paratrimastix pyriformis TaxID=342808 RepID=A0ABQ8USD9_9EUKA|nr:hypothetical protein PAPYR_1207 [Paratrimastix pyriformis]
MRSAWLFVFLFGGALCTLDNLLRALEETDIACGGNPICFANVLSSCDFCANVMMSPEPGSEEDCKESLYLSLRPIYRECRKKCLTPSGIDRTCIEECTTRNVLDSLATYDECVAPMEKQEPVRDDQPPSNEQFDTLVAAIGYSGRDWVPGPLSGLPRSLAYAGGYYYPLRYTPTLNQYQTLTSFEPKNVGPAYGLLYTPRATYGLGTTQLQRLSYSARTSFSNARTLPVGLCGLRGCQRCI